MNRFDLFATAGDSILRLVLAFCLIFLLTGVGTGYYFGKNSVKPQTETELAKAAYKRGVEKGVLAVVNYDRKNAGQEPYGSYKEFEHDLDKQVEESGELVEFAENLIKERKEADAKKAELNKKYPQPWVKK